jgi:hypothetical protein
MVITHLSPCGGSYPFDTGQPRGVGLGKRLTHRSGYHAQLAQLHGLVKTYVVGFPMGFGLPHKPKSFSLGFLTSSMMIMVLIAPLEL